MADEATQTQQREWISRCMESMDAVLDEETRNTVMQNCGIQCISRSNMDKAARLWKISNDIDDFLRRLNETGIGGGRLKREGNIIRGGYDKCYCRIVATTRKPISLTYCNCSCGWYKGLFEAAFGKPVDVKITSSVINGADTCEFEIRVDIE